MSPELQAWRAGGSFHSLLGLSVFVRNHRNPGQPRLLLIHGFPSASVDWAPLWSQLSRRFELLALDLPGFGFSDKPLSLPYSIGLQADFCQALLQLMGWDSAPVHLLAHDYGDTVAQELLARASEARLRLVSVVFLNGGLLPESHRPRLVQKLLARPRLGPLLARFLGERAFVRSMLAISGRQPPQAAVLADLWGLLKHHQGTRVLPKLLGYMAERRQYRSRWVGALTDTAVPLRLVCGAADPISGAHLAARYAELVPHADVVLLPQVGHYPQLEAPQQVLDAFLAFHTELQARVNN